MYFKIFIYSYVYFQQPLLQSSVSHDPSEIILIGWFDAQEHFGPCTFAAIYFSFFNPEMKYRKRSLFFNGSNWWIKQANSFLLFKIPIS